MMKNIFFVMLMLCSASGAVAQQIGFTYQAVALDESKAEGFGRDSKGQVLLNQALKVRFSIHEQSADGTVQYQEVHETTTDIFGIFRVVIGSGDKLVGTSLETLQWSDQAYFMQVEIDLGNGFINMGEEVIVVPPFGLNNSVQLLNLSGTQLSISEGNNVDLSSIFNSARLSETEVDAFVANNGYLLLEVDGSATNELQNLTSNGTAGHLAISDGNQIIINVNDADADPLNEIQDLQLLNNQLIITNNPAATSINLSPFLGNNLTEADVDNMVANNGYLTLETDGSITNEIQDLNLTGNTLTITNNPASTNIDLSPYRNVFVTTNNITSNENGNYTSDDFVYGSSSLDHPAAEAHRNRFFFDKSKGALRAGSTNDASWNDANRGFYSTAFGLNNIALGVSSFSAGENNNSLGASSTSLGVGNTASGSFSFSVGTSNTASGYSSFAGGFANFATGYNAFALGDNSSALGDYSKVFAHNSTAYSYGETVLGTLATAYTPVGDVTPTDRLFTIGNGTYDFNSTPPYSFTRSDAFVMLKNGNTRLHGQLTIDADNVNGAGEAYTLPGQDGEANQTLVTDGNGTVSWVNSGVGAFSTTSNLTSNAPGNYATDDFVFGSPFLSDDGDTNHASRFFFDKSSSAFRAGYSSLFAWDESLFPWGNYSVGLGYDPIATGLASVALGYSNGASGSYAIAIGNQSIAGASGSVALGMLNNVSGQESMSIGNNNVVTGTQSFAIGNTNQIPFGAQNAFVIGSNSAASASHSMALGHAASASGEESTAIGFQASASNLRSMALGYYSSANAPEGISIGSQVSSTGFRSMALGFANISSGQDSRALGTGVQAFSYGETALGLWNTPYIISQSGLLFNNTDRLLSIGNGQDANNRSDALVMLKNGNTRLHGQLTIDADNVNGAGEQYTLPGQDGAANQVMTTDGNGNVSWNTPTALTENDVDNFVSNNGYLTSEVDGSITNEIQDLNLAGNTLTITNNAAPTNIDLTPYQNVFETTNGVTSNENGNYATDDFVFGSPVSFNDWSVHHRSRMFFDKSKSAFRAGYAITGVWDDNAVGDHSFAFGYQSRASGIHSYSMGGNASGTNAISFGFGSIALGTSSIVLGVGSLSLLQSIDAISIGASATTQYNYGISIGSSSTAGGLNSVTIGRQALSGAHYSIALGSNAATLSNAVNAIAIGRATQAIGAQSVALGSFASAHSFGEIVLGYYNTSYLPNSSTSYNLNDRLFVIGNGEGDQLRSDALIMLKNGNTRLHGQLTIDADNVNGAGEQYTLPGQDGAENQTLVTDGNGTVSWQNATESILDRTTTIISNENGNYTTDSFIIGSPSLDDDGDANHDTRLFFEKSTGAFRVGTVNDFEWNAFERGLNSIAMGNGNIARGDYSLSFGLDNLAHSASSVAIGTNNVAEGYNSIALGRNVSTTGLHSMALSFYSSARSFGETTMGMFATDYIPNATQSFDTNDRLFTIGNGTTDATRSNALVIFKNGDANFNGQLTIDADNVSGIGQGYTLPGQDGASGQLMLTDGAGHASWSNIINGDLTVAGVFSNPSDSRLKRNITPLSNSLNNVTTLKGFNYNWNSHTTQDTVALQTGLIAQEVEKIFPELVKTDEEGFKSVNYIGLIPHLIEAIKELKAGNERLKEENLILKNENQKRLQSLEDKLLQFEFFLEKKR